MSNSVNIICLKWGDLYDSEYVNKLYRGVNGFLKRPFEFHCFTDNDQNIESPVICHDIARLEAEPILHRNIFLKLAAINTLTGLSGTTLFLDLDIIITGDLDVFFEHEPDKFCIIHNWISKRKQIFRKRPDIGNSSVFRFEFGKCDHALQAYLDNPQDAEENFPTEQAFLSHCMNNRAYWPEEWVRSFKFNCRPTFPLNLFLKPNIPAESRIIAFHGKPNPPQVISGYTQGPVHHRTLPLKELEKYWS